MQQDSDPGIFQFHDDGFEISFQDTRKYIRWQDIEEIHAYKKDLFTCDEICLDIILQKTVVSISEETKGWDYFTGIINQQFPSIKAGWDWEVAKPAFAANFNIIYQRDK